MTPTATMEMAGHLGFSLAIHDNKLRMSGKSPPPAELLSAIRANKVELLRMLSARPTFTGDEIVVYCDFYCSRPVAERAAMTKLATSIRQATGWPRESCDMEGCRQSWLAAGSPPGPFTLAQDGLVQREAVVAVDSKENE